MNKNSRGDNRPRRRGTVRRKQFVAMSVAILVIYIVYRTFMPGSQSLYEPYAESDIAQNKFLQGKRKTEAPHFERSANLNIPETDLRDINNVKDDEIDGIDIDDDEDEGDDYESEENMEEKASNNELQGAVNVEQNKTDANKYNKSSESLKKMDPFVVSKGKEMTTNGTLKYNMTLTNRTKGNALTGMPKLSLNLVNDTAANVKAMEKIIPREKNDLDEYKKQLVQDFSEETKVLTDLVEESLTKHTKNLTDVQWQNKTEITKGNVTNLIEKFSSKAKQTIKLATDLLYNTSVSVAYLKQNKNELNTTLPDAAFAIEYQNLIKYANAVVANASKGAADIDKEAKEKFLDKYAFKAQTLAKFAHTLFTNATKEVNDSKQVLMNKEATKQEDRPVQSDVKNKTENVFI